jgi:hypothetical protein
MESKKYLQLVVVVSLLVLAGSKDLEFKDKSLHIHPSASDQMALLK